MTTNRQHFQWLEFHIKIDGMAGKQCVFSPQKAGERSLFLKLWLEFQIYLSGHPVHVLHTVQKTGETSYSKYPLNADIICKLALEKQEMPPLAFMA